MGRDCSRPIFSLYLLSRCRLRVFALIFKAMIHLKKKIVTDESMRPVAVLIDYEDWQKIEQILENYQTEESSDLNRFAGVLRQDGEDFLEFQRRIRGEWD